MIYLPVYSGGKGNIFIYLKIDSSIGNQYVASLVINKIRCLCQILKSIKMVNFPCLRQD